MSRSSGEEKDVRLSLTWELTRPALPLPGTNVSPGVYNQELLHKVVPDEQLAPFIAFARAHPAVPPDPQLIHARHALTSCTLADMLVLCSIGLVHKDLTEDHFPLKPERFTTDGLEVAVTNAAMDASEIEAEVDRFGYRQAVLEELFAFIIRCWNGRGRIVARGSSWARADGCRFVPVLREDRLTLEEIELRPRRLDKGEHLLIASKALGRKL